MRAFARLFLKNRDGNFGIITAVLLPALLMTVGLALDVTEMSRKREALQDAVDSAALSAASGLAAKGISQNDARSLAAAFIAAHMGSGQSGDARDPLAPTIDIAQASMGNNSKTYTVKVVASYNVKLSGFQTLLGYETARVSASSVAVSSTEARNPLSMYLVLDRSGSMLWVTSTIDTSRNACNNYYEERKPDPIFESPCYVKKIDSLKTAVSALTTQFEATDPTHALIRTGAVSYNNLANAPSPLAWGTAATTAYVNALTPWNGTNSTDALQIAYNSLKNPSETQAHLSKSGLVPMKFIILMTDGANDTPNIDATTKTVCDSAKRDGIQIFTVAFAAPDQGKQLLAYCSSGSSFAFEAENMPQLVQAFQTIAAKASKLSNRLTQ